MLTLVADRGVFGGGHVLSRAGAVWNAATRMFSQYLNAADQVVIASDHNPLVWLRQKRDPRGKFARWLLELEGINYTVRYRRGTEDLAADYLSRNTLTFDSQIYDESYKAN